MSPESGQIPMPDPAIENLRLEILRRKTPLERFEMGMNLIRTAREWKAARVAALHPDWTPGQVRKETAKIFLHAVG